MMPASMQDVDRLPRNLQVGRAMTLLNEALDIVDNLEDRPDIGARLQHVIECLREECTE